MITFVMSNSIPFPGQLAFLKRGFSLCPYACTFTFHLDVLNRGGHKSDFFLNKIPSKH